jgi:hypothetical protein
MHPILLRGGSSAPAGVYRELHSGRMVYLDTSGTLPGQLNSESYVQVPQAAMLNPRITRHPAPARHEGRPA